MRSFACALCSLKCMPAYKCQHIGFLVEYRSNAAARSQVDLDWRCLAGERDSFAADMVLISDPVPDWFMHAPVWASAR